MRGRLVTSKIERKVLRNPLARGMPFLKGEILLTRTNLSQRAHG